jgi:hypothetical protein
MLFSLKNRFNVLRCGLSGSGHKFRYGASSEHGLVKRCLHCKHEEPVKTAPRELAVF